MSARAIVIFLFIFSSLPGLVSAQDSAMKADIQGLELRITNIVTGMDKRLTNQINDLDKRLTTQISDLDKRLTNQINDLDKRLISLETTVGGMDKRLTKQIDILFWVIGALIGVVLTVIALPQLLGYFQERRSRAELRDIVEELKQQMARQQDEIDDLKSRRIMTPS